MTMEDSTSEKALGNKQKTKKKSSNDNNKQENTVKPKAKKNSKKKVSSAKENEKEAEMISTPSSELGLFSYHEIANNKEASALIYDLVRCFTCNSTLPQKELDVLNETLYHKTVSVFFHILNSCVEKIFKKILNAGFLPMKKVVKKDASCQTDFHCGIEE